MPAKTVRKSIAAIVLCALASGLTGCQADYGADIHNKTPTPIFAQLMVKANDRNQAASMGASRRLGPGDRAALGPVRANARPGSVFLVVDSLNNPNTPISADLTPGTAFLEVVQEGDKTGGPIRLVEKR
jgi:hypothetical protein